MKVKAIKDYNDTQLKRLVKTDEELDVTKERAAVLITAKVAVVADQETSKEETTEKPKRRKKAEA